MIFDWIFMSLGFVRKSVYDDMRYEAEKYEKRLMNEEKRNRACIIERENLKKEIAGFEMTEFELREQVNAYKQKYSDEVQKRLKLIEIIAESEIVIKAGDGETKTLWYDAKEDPPKNSRDVLIWSETGSDVGYYDVTVGWIRKDGVLIDVKYWSEFSEPIVPKTVAREVDNMVAD